MPPGGDPVRAQLDGLRLRPEELVTRFGVGQRVAVRIGAFLAAGLSMTATVVEVLGEDAELRRLLMTGQALDLAPTPAELLSWLAAEPKPDSPVLAIADDGQGGPVLCLEEELLAASVWQESAVAVRVADPGAALLAGGGAPSAAAQLDATELPVLERTFLTAVEPDRRIEALTSLITLGNLPAPQRAGLLMQALASPDTDVARGGLTLLEGAGLPRALAEALRDLEDTSIPIRLHAIDHLRTALANEDPDPVLLAAVLLVARRVLWIEADLTARRGLVLLLGEAMRAPVASAANVREVIRTLVKASLDAPAAMSLTIRRAVLRLATVAAEETATALWEQAAALGNAEVAVYILALLGELPMASAEEEERFCRELMRRVFFGASADATVRPNLAQLEAGLRHRGERGVDQLIAVLPELRPDLTADVAACLDRLAARLPTGSVGRERARLALLEQLGRATPKCALEILGSRMLANDELDGPEASSVARELVARMGIFLLPDVWEECARVFERLGVNALAPLAEALTDPGTDPDILPRALDLLARSLAARSPGAAYTADNRQRVLRLLVEGAGSPESLRGAVIEAAGALVRSPAAAPDEATATLAMFVGALEAAEVMAADDALAPERVHLDAQLASRRDLAPEAQAALEACFQRVLDSPNEDSLELLVPVTADERPWTGRIYQATGAERRYTVTLPAAVEGMTALAENGADGRLFRRRFLSLHCAWERVGAADEWGPACTTLLASKIAQLAASPRATEGTRKLFLDSLAQSKYLLLSDEGDLPLVRAVAGALEHSPAARQRDLGFTVLVRLVDARREALAFEEAERAILLDATTRIAALRGLEAPDEAVGMNQATHVWNQVRAGLRQGLPGSERLARQLLPCRYLSEDQRQALGTSLALLESGD